MNTIMSVINGQTVACTQAVIEKRYPATGEVIAKIPPATLAMLDEAVRHAKAAQVCEDGYFLSPAILIGCNDDMVCVVDEIFGSVMSVLRFKDEVEAISRANATEFDLGAGILTQNLSRAHRVADQLQSGNIWINSYNLIPPGFPFGGSKQSGFGREGSVYGLGAYTEVNAIYVQL